MSGDLYDQDPTHVVRYTTLRGHGVYWNNGAHSGMVTSAVMKARLRHARRPDVLAIVLLATLIFRAYIPVGFMPASGTPFLVELCPAYAGGAPAHHAHHHNSQGQADFQNCPFGSAPALGPVSHLIAFEPAERIASFVAIPAERGRLVRRLLHAHQPRGPPSLA